MKVNALFLLFTPHFLGQIYGDNTPAVILALSWVVSGGIGSIIGSRKGAGLYGFFLGLLLGPIGWLMVAVSKGNRIKCQACREYIDPQASICPKCHANPLRSNKKMPLPPRRAFDNLIQVARDGEDLGKVSPDRLCEMITSGDLTLQDHFFDAERNQWLTLNECRSISIGEPNS